MEASRQHLHIKINATIDIFVREYIHSSSQSEKLICWITTGKNHHLQAGAKNINSMFAVSSVDAAKLYYESFKNLQKAFDKPLKSTICSFVANEEQNAIGDMLMKILISFVSLKGLSEGLVS